MPSPRCVGAGRRARSTRWRRRCSLDDARSIRGPTRLPRHRRDARGRDDERARRRRAPGGDRPRACGARVSAATAWRQRRESNAPSWLRDSRAPSPRAASTLRPPAGRRSARAARSAGQELTSDRADYSVFWLDGASCPTMGSSRRRRRWRCGVFADATAAGFDRLTVARGATRAELLALSSSSRRPSPRPPPGAAASIERARTSDATAATGRGTPLEADQLTEGRGPLVGVWEGIASAAPATSTSSRAWCSRFGQQLRENRGALMPLAQLTSHDAYTVTHIANVALLAMAIGEALGLNAQFVHDPGARRAPARHRQAEGAARRPELAGPPDRVAAGADEEASRGWRAAADGDARRADLAVIVAFEHHLDDNGGGYPAVPPAWTIHLASAITHVVDVYDALRSNRPYRGRASRPKSCADDAADAGTVFDPLLLQASSSASRHVSRSLPGRRRPTRRWGPGRTPRLQSPRPEPIRPGAMTNAPANSGQRRCASHPDRR